MGALVRMFLFVLPGLYRLVQGLLIVRRGVTIVPFVIGLVTSLTLAYAYWHEANVGITAAFSSLTTILQTIDVGGSDAMCWVSAFGVFSACRIVIQAAGIGLSMLVTQFITLQTLKLSQWLLDAAVMASHR